jgi:rsbT co-antagonist protein RsbR
MSDQTSKLASILRRREAHVHADWVNELARVTPSGTIDKSEIEEQSRTFVRLLTAALQQDAGGDITGPAWAPIREMLTALSASRAHQGFSPTETAMFIFSMKQPIFAAVRD